MPGSTSNVIVINCDSLRRDFVGAYGSAVRTPNVDRLAAESTVFEQHFSEGLPTLPTRTAFWTGRFTFPFRGWQPFEVPDVLLAEALWSRGYRSALITDVYHMHKPGMNCGRGFDEVVFIRGQEYDPYATEEVPLPAPFERYYRLRGDGQDAMWRARYEQYQRNVTGRQDEREYFVAQVCRRAADWLERQVHKEGRRERLFLWVDNFDPHEPWDPPAPFDSMYQAVPAAVDSRAGTEGSGGDRARTVWTVRPRTSPGAPGAPGAPAREWEPIDPVPGPIAGYMSPEDVGRTVELYAGEVSLVDRWVGYLLDRIRELDLLGNSLVVFTTDHGEPFGEHGIIRKARPWPYQELSHIPLIVRHPDGTGAGKRVAAFTHTCDLFPTVLEFLGIDPYGELVTGRNHGQTAPVHARSLLPLLRGDASGALGFGVSCYHRGSWSIRTPEWSYLFTPESAAGRGGGIASPELYDRRADPAEQRNVIGDEPGVAAELEARLREHVAGLR